MTTPTRTADDLAIATLALAFATDPGMRWLLPDPDRYHRGFPDLVRLAGGEGFEAGTVDVLEHGAAVAVWVPPGAAQDEEGWARLFTDHVDPERLEAVFAWGAEVERHHPSEPHWYLAVLGVDPHRQGGGLGTRLLRAGLERCDRDMLPAYLESANPRNRVLYERHGFEVFAEIQVADAPPIWPMRRPARAPRAPEPTLPPRVVGDDASPSRPVSPG